MIRHARRIGSVLLIATVACGNGLQAIKKWTGDFAGCESADLGQYVTVDNIKMELLQAISYIIEQNTAALETELADIAKVVGLDTIRCAILATELALSPPAGSDTSQPRFIAPGIARANAWLAKQGTSASAATAAKKGTP